MDITEWRVFRGSGHEDGLRRPTFPSSWKSGQKSRKKPMVSSLPCALKILQSCQCVPHVRVGVPFSFCHRIVSAPVPLPLMPTVNNTSVSTVATVSGSGARGKSIRHTLRKRIYFRERVVQSHKFTAQHSAGGFLNRRFKWRFWALLPPRAKVPRARKRETLLAPEHETPLYQESISHSTPR